MGEGVTPSEPGAVLSAEAAIDYWDRRHRARGPLLSGGHLGFDHATNEIFYALRLGRLVDGIGDISSTAAPLRVLDAGCGKGYFSRAMASFGHRVEGIDASDHAVSQCQAERVGGDSYHRSLLADWRPPYLYDVVFSVDVLFHIMDDDLWEASVRNLASLVRWGGRLLLADHDEATDRVWGDYQKTRAGHRYRTVLEGAVRSDGFLAYRFRDSQVGFHTFTRTA